MSSRPERLPLRVCRDTPPFEWDQRRWEAIRAKAEVCDRIHLHTGEEYDAERNIEFGWEEDVQWLGAAIHALCCENAALKEDITDALFVLEDHQRREK